MKEKLFLSPVTETEINKIIKALKDSATEHDDKAPLRLARFSVSRSGRRYRCAVRFNRFS